MQQAARDGSDAPRRSTAAAPVPRPRPPALAEPALVPQPRSRDADTAAALTPYVPRLAAEWDLDVPGALWRELDATCCFVDISGFTALSERLARRGRVGAEELTAVLNHVFSRMLGVAYGKGGALLKFGGDALLLAFTHGDHPVLAAEAAVAMRTVLRQARDFPTSVGRVNLRMSVGVHSGCFDLFRVGHSHRELLIAGPAATTTTRMEQVAEAGEIVVSPATAERLPEGAVGDPKGAGWLLRWRQAPVAGPGPAAARAVPVAAVETSVPLALRTRLADPEGPEHRIATVGFVKFTGLDDLLARGGPQAAAEALHEVVGAVQDAADAESATFLASDIDADGGKLILTTGVPATMDDDEGRLLRAARAIVSRPLPLPVRVGVNRGYVFAADIGTEFRRTYTVMGDTVNLAARLMAAASPGDVYSTVGAIEHSSTTFTLEALEPFYVKGKSEPVRAFRVGVATGARSRTRGALPFRGRDTELRVLLDAFRTAQAGSGSVAVIEAERGSGKSRLVAELVDTVGDDAAVLVLQGEPFGVSVPYLPLRAPLRMLLGIDAVDRPAAGRQLVETLQRIAPDLVPYAPLLAPVVDVEVPPTPESAAVAADFVRDRVAAVVVQTLAAACDGPLLVVAEDAHWFDDTTAGICTRVARAAKSQPWLVCTTRRVDAGGFDPIDADIRFVLTPLLDDAVRALVEGATAEAPLRPHEREALVTRSGGNPLFLEELLQLMREGDTGALPDSLEAVAMRQIDALPAGSRRVLRLASVLGRAFDRDLLVRLLDDEHVDVGGDPLAALRHVLVVDPDGQVRFRHGVFQEAAYQSLPFRTRLGLHSQVADVIESSARDAGDVAALLSFHALAAQDWQRCWRYARQAATVAARGHAISEAAAHLERAVDAARHLADVPADDVAQALVDLGWQLEVLGEYDRADDAYRRAATASRNDVARRAEIADRRAYIRSEYQGRCTAALRQARAGRSQLAHAPAGDRTDRLRARLLSREADVRMRQGRLTDAIACANQAIEQAERADDKGALALALTVLDVSLMQVGRSADATHMDRVLALYEELGDRLRSGVALSALGSQAYFEGTWADAADYYRRAADAARSAGDAAGEAIALGNLGEIRVNQGALDEAVALLTPARRTLESFGYRLSSAWTTLHLGRAQAFLGDTGGGLALVQAAVAAYDDTGLAPSLVEGLAYLGEVHAHAGRLAEADAALGRARERLDAVKGTPLASLVQRVELTVAALSGDVATFSAAMPGFADEARRLGATYDLLVVLTLAGRLGVGDGEHATSALAAQLGVVTVAPLPAG